jgi:hypothetical protein
VYITTLTKIQVIYIDVIYVHCRFISFNYVLFWRIPKLMSNTTVVMLGSDLVEFAFLWHVFEKFHKAEWLWGLDGYKFYLNVAVLITCTSLRGDCDF